MGRRSDHTRSELEALFIHEGYRQLAEVGLARFSAREVAKRVGYSIGTLYNIFGNADLLLAAINGKTLGLWIDELRARLVVSGEDRIATLVQEYFVFALGHPKTWAAVYEHHMVDHTRMPEAYEMRVAEIMAIVDAELAAVVPGIGPEALRSLARSLLATVHGHCVFALNQTLSMLGDAVPAEDAALARVREAIEAARRPSRREHARANDH